MPSEIVLVESLDAPRSDGQLISVPAIAEYSTTGNGPAVHPLLKANDDLAAPFSSRIDEATLLEHFRTHSLRDVQTRALDMPLTIRARLRRRNPGIEDPLHVGEDPLGFEGHVATAAILEPNTLFIEGQGEPNGIHRPETEEQEFGAALLKDRIEAVFTIPPANRDSLLQDQIAREIRDRK